MFLALNTIQVVLYSLSLVFMIALAVGITVFLNRHNNKENKETIEKFVHQENFNPLEKNDERLKTIHHQLKSASPGKILFPYYKKDTQREIYLICYADRMGLTSYFKHYLQFCVLYHKSTDLRSCSIIPMEKMSVNTPRNVNIISSVTDFDNNFVLITREQGSAQYDLSGDIQNLIIRYFINTQLKLEGIYIGDNGLTVTTEQERDQKEILNILEFSVKLAEIIETKGTG